jgi:hypothetical protein
LQIARWWFLGLLSTPESERTLSGGQIGDLAAKVCELAVFKLTDADELAALNDVEPCIKTAVPERNLAVHGVRDLLPDATVGARVTRGEYKGTLQHLPMIKEVNRIIDVIQPLLHRHGAIEV